MLDHRAVDLVADRAILLEFHATGNYESDTPWARPAPYAEYRDEWFHTVQTDQFLGSLSESMRDWRTIAEIWESDGRTAGYIWVTFSEIDGYDLNVAEVRDMGVVLDFRRQGVASKMMARAEELARKRGADLLRSEASIENVASQNLHAKLGLQPIRVYYEKVLSPNISAASGRS